MQEGIYELDENMKLIKVDTTPKEVQIGQVIRWGGNMAWLPEDFVVVGKLDINNNYLKMIALKNFRYHNTEAYSLKHLDDKTLWHGQHMYILDGNVIPLVDVENIKVLADKKKAEDELIAEEKQKVADAHKKKYENPDNIKVGDILHYSFGYDMTINVFAKVLSRTDKSLVCQEVDTCLSGGDFNCQAVAGDKVKEGKKPFRVLIKWHNSVNYGKYYNLAGNGEHWSVYQKGQKLYENHMD